MELAETVVGNPPRSYNVIHIHKVHLLLCSVTRAVKHEPRFFKESIINMHCHAALHMSEHTDVRLTSHATQPRAPPTHVTLPATSFLFHVVTGLLKIPNCYMYFSSLFTFWHSVFYEAAECDSSHQESLN